MGTIKYHMCLNVREALRNQDFGMFTEEDGPVSTDDGFKFLCDQLAMGREVMPFGVACEGFDYSGKGCPGHPVETVEEMKDSDGITG